MSVNPPGEAGSESDWGSQQIGELAGWWLRVGATVIDGIIVGVVGLVVHLVLGPTIGGVLNVAVEGVYLIFMIGGRGQTVGCMAMATRVVASDGSPQIGFGRAAVRWIVQPILFLALFVPGVVDLLWPLWDRQRQTLHDKAAGTLVIRTR